MALQGHDRSALRFWRLAFACANLPPVLIDAHFVVGDRFLLPPTQIGAIRRAGPVIRPADRVRLRGRNGLRLRRFTRLVPGSVAYTVPHGVLQMHFTFGDHLELP